MKLLKKYFAHLSGLIVFTVYLTTLAPSVIQIDSGELAAVQSTLGVAHPTGYPLFTITGYLFSLLPFPFSKIYLLNLLAAIWCSLGIGFFVYTAKIILDNIEEFIPRKHALAKKASKKEKKKRAEEPAIQVRKEGRIPELKKYISLITGGFILAFSRTYWFQSTSVEVYSLHIFLISPIILFLIKGYLYNDDPLKISLKNPWLYFAFFLALGFTNHMTTLLILPGTAYLFFNKYRFKKDSFKQIGLMLLIFFPLLFLLYSYLPLRAQQEPLLNWGNPIDIERIMRHISGKQYQVWLFSSTEAAKKQLEYFISSLINEFNINLLISAAGVFASYIMGKKIFLFILITFISTVLYSINYDINDIDSYFILAYISLSFFAVFGAVTFLSFLKSKKYSYSISAGFIALLIAVQIYINYKKVDQSNVHTFEDYTKELINSTKENSIIFSYQWDYFISQSYYIQFAENFRRDAVIIDKELLRRSWYYNQLNTAYPGLLDGVRTEVNLFLNALAPFERSEDFDPNLLENLFRKIMTNLVKTNIDKRNFYIAPEIFENEMQKGEFTLPENYTLVPDLFLFKVVEGSEYVPAANPNFNIRFPEKRNHYINMIENFVGSMLASRALYEMQFDKIERAKVYINKIKNDLPGYILPPGLAEVLKR